MSETLSFLPRSIGELKEILRDELLYIKKKGLKRLVCTVLNTIIQLI